MITLTKEDLVSLDKYIADLPFKFAKPLVDFLNSKVQQAQKEEELPDVKELDLDKKPKLKKP